MLRTKKLAPVVKHVENKEQTALQAVVYSQQQLQVQTDRLEQIIIYKKEYSDRHVTPHAESYSSHQFKEINRFIAQLDDTIKQQQKVVELAQREVEIKHVKWESTRTRSDAMHKMIDRLQAGELKLEQKSDQKLMDEVALRSSLKLADWQS